MVDMILFPSSYFDIKIVDEDLQKEYEAVISTGLFQVALFGYDQWFNDNKLVVTGAPESEHLAVYDRYAPYNGIYQQYISMKGYTGRRSKRDT